MYYCVILQQKKNGHTETAILPIDELYYPDLAVVHSFSNYGIRLVYKCSKACKMVTHMFKIQSDFIN